MLVAACSFKAAELPAQILVYILVLRLTLSLSYARRHCWRLGSLKTLTFRRW